MLLKRDLTSSRAILKYGHQMILPFVNGLVLGKNSQAVHMESPARYMESPAKGLRSYLKCRCDKANDCLYNPVVSHML